MNEQKIAVITDTGTDTPTDFATAHDVRTVALVINYSNGDSFRSGFEINSSEVIDRFAKEIPTTSLPSPSEIRSTLEAVRADGYESAVFVTISSGLSATNHAAHLVASQMPDFPATIVDTKSVGIAAGLVVMGAVRMVEEGVPYEELVDRLEALAKKTYGYFTVRELSYLHHGGRINEATYRLGSILNLKPVFTCDDEGKYVTVKKCRGWEKALVSELSLIRSHAERFGRVICAVCCTKAKPRMEELVQKIRELIPNCIEVVKTELTPDLVVHAGPSLVGMVAQPLNAS